MNNLDIDTEGWKGWKCPNCQSEFSFSPDTEPECPECNNWPPPKEAQH